MERQQLPPLKALYVFSVASRYLNFSKAAEALFITPSAVSHQIKRLEKVLNCELFEKQGKALVLTPAAHTFSLVINQCFSQIQYATNELTGINRNIIQLGVDSALAVQRLTPELGLWQEYFPELDFRVRMLSCEDKLEALDLDLIFGKKVLSPFYNSELVCEEQYYPVASQALIGAMQGRTLKARLSNSVLIDLDGINTWEHWCAFKSMEKIKPTKIIYFSHTLLVLQAVLSGQGVALLDKNLIKNELASERLVLLDEVAFTPPQTGYYVSLHKRRIGDANLAKLIQWLRHLLS